MSRESCRAVRLVRVRLRLRLRVTSGWGWGWGWGYLAAMRSCCSVEEVSCEALLEGGRREPALCTARALPPRLPPSRSVYSAAAWSGSGLGLGGLGLGLG